MTLEEELMKEGFIAYGPHPISEMPQCIGYIERENKWGDETFIKEIRIVRGNVARDDCEN